MTIPARLLPLAALLTGALLVTGCSAISSADSDEPITVTGSATVEPLTRLAGVEGKATLEMTSQGTYDGFDKFCAGESDINNASSAITQEYLDKCEENGVEFVELPLGIDALSMVTNVENPKVDNLSMEEIEKIWAPDSDVKTWANVREGLPEDEINLYGRPEGSGTFSYFTALVNGEAGAIRDDYEKTDSIDELTKWISQDSHGLGFMGVGNYLAADGDERNSMTTLAIDGVEPSLGNVQDHTYPLSRPLFIYVSVDALDNKDGVEEFVTGMVDNAASLVPRVYFYGLTDEAYDAVAKRLEERTAGSLLEGDPFQEIDINEALAES